MALLIHVSTGYAAETHLSGTKEDADPSPLGNPTIFPLGTIVDDLPRAGRDNMIDLLYRF